MLLSVMASFRMARARPRADESCGLEIHLLGLRVLFRKIGDRIAEVVERNGRAPR